jgi:hypothetical protein
MRMKALICAAALAASASGCMSDAKPGAGKTFTYDCSGLGKGWGDCTEQADRQCGAHNYTTVSQVADSDAKGAGGSTEMKRTLVVACR